jgi:hypothetical protein
MGNDPMPQHLADAPRCGAKTRKGPPCRQPSMPNGRCKMHGGKSTGPPKGSQNALKHGYYTAEAKEQRRQVRELIRDAQQLVGEM